MPPDVSARIAVSGGGDVLCRVARRFRVDGLVDLVLTLRNETPRDVLADAYLGGNVRRRVLQAVIASGSEFSSATAVDAENVPDLFLEINGTRCSVALPPASEQVALPASDGSPYALVAAESQVPALSGPEPLPAAAAATPPGPVAAPTVVAPRGSSAAANATIALVLFGLILGGTSIYVLLPRVTDVGAPPDAAAGAHVDIPYHAAGWGDAAYAVRRADGSVFASGPLALGWGSIAFDAPQPQRDELLRVAIDVRGPFGAAHDAETFIVRAAAPAPAPVAARPVRRPNGATPAIRNVAVDDTNVASGAKFDVYYDIAASGGSIVLEDLSSGIVYARTTLSPAGRSTLTAPIVRTDRSLALIVRATKNGHAATSRIGIVVHAGDAAGAPDAAVPPSDGEPVAAGSPTLGIARTLFTAGETIRVTIGHAAAGASVSLLDDRGQEIDRQPVSPIAPTVSFRAPAVTATRAFVLALTDPNGAGSETVIRRIRIRP